MSEPEFDTSQDVVVETVSTFESRKESGLVTRLFIALSFGSIKTKEEAEKVMIAVAVIIFLISLYFFLR
jgi:hypothetical protein